MGNLLYDKRPELAIRNWNNALEADENFAMGWRNLAFGAFYHESRVNKAIEYQMTAIELDGDQPIWFAELETYYDQSDMDVVECLDVLSAHIETVKKDINAPKSLVKLYNLNGEYAKAISLLEKHHFRTWEGGKTIYYHYVDAHTLQALELMKSGKNQDAIIELERATEYPENLEVGKPLDDERNAMIYYFEGLAYENMGEGAKASLSFKKSIDAQNSLSWPDLPYYQAKSLERMGNKEEARDIYKELVKEGNERLQKGQAGSGIGIEENVMISDRNISEAYYLKALGSHGLGDESEAESLFEQSIRTYKNNLWAKVHSEFSKEK